MKKLSILLISVFALITAFLSTQEVVAVDYYASINANDSLNEFSADLTSLLTSTHNYKSYGSSYNTVLAEGAAISPGSSSLELFYTGYIDTASNAGGGNQYDWNKEHVWPKSQTGGENSAPANDIHNIRPTNTKINSTRSNLPFGEDFGGSIAYAAVAYADGSTYCYYGNGYFEPRDEVKGDCARIIFYLLTRYDSLNLDVNTVGDMDMLLKWHYADPVDTYESNINEAIYEFQGNRNPYIDHPEFVDKMFPNEYGVSFEELNDINIVSEATQNVTLPTTAGSYNITWTSSDTNALSTSGVIFRDIKDVTVKLTAAITKEGMVGTKDFYVTVKARDLELYESFIYADVLNSLSIDYTDNTIYDEAVAKTGAIDNSGATGNFLNLTIGDNYASNFSLDEEEFFLTLEDKGTSTNGVSFYKTETLTLNNNAIVKLSSLSGAIKSVKVTYDGTYTGTSLSTTTSGGTELANGVAVNINSNDVYLIQSDSQGRITSIEITYITGVSNYDVSNIDFYFGFEISQSAYNELEKTNNFEMGMLYIDSTLVSKDIDELYNNEDIATFITNNNLNKKTLSKNTSDDSYMFSATLDSDVTTKVKACGYMVYEGKVYFTNTVDRSIADVANIYINQYAEEQLVSKYINLLKHIIK